MTVIDTNITIEKVKGNKEIHENITVITVLEYPVILAYKKFYGKIYTLRQIDIELAINLQIKLRKLGKPKPIADLLIAAICINRNEELITKDKDFLDIAKVSDLKVKLV